MKRKQREPASKPQRGARAIDPKRLTGVRGGTDLGITVEVGPAPTLVQMQHNEALLRAGGAR